MLDLISDWWNWVFQDLMNGSILLMFLFGWEIFMIPFGLAFLGIGMIFAIFASLVERK